MEMGTVQVQRPSSAKAQDALLDRLRARRPQIEDALLTRAVAVSGSTSGDPECNHGVRSAVRAALDHALAALERPGEDPPLPPVLLAQARMAARDGVALDVVQRCYIAGHALLVDFFVEDAGAVALGLAALQILLRTLARCLDCVLVLVGEEHARELEACHCSAEQRDAERIDRLLAGELPGLSQFSYKFETHHLGIVAKGPEAAGVIRSLAASLDRRLLSVQRQDGEVWAWLGGRLPVDPRALQDATRSPDVFLAFGEPAQGMGGWRLTHRQAKAAMAVALRIPKSSVYYAEVALLASIFHDHLLSTSLRQLYLTPLEAGRDGGGSARETLRAYFATERNVSAAAAALGVSRRTVANRLRAVEDHLGRPLSTCAAEMEIALKLHDLEPVPVGHGSSGAN
jgi:PucR C-terminal helix-turn-helix domain/GGDEF-like domain